MCPQRPPRFRPAWTLSLDRMAKQRRKLLRSTYPATQNKAKDFSRKIKRRFRLNKRRIKLQLADELANANPTTEASIMKRALALEVQNAVTPTKVDADDFTKVIQSMQPSPDTTKVVHVNPFQVPDSFLQTLIASITTQLKSKKSPGSDRIRTDIFRLAHGMFAKAALELWRAVGRLSSVPPLLRSGLLVPIYKENGDPAVPQNNRPITLTHAFRILISTLLVMELRKHYRESLENKWGFQDRTNTECAIIFAVNKLRTNLRYAALLDLNKAFDCVPRHTLQKMVDKQLQIGLSNMIRPLLWPMRLKTKNQKSRNSILTLAGVPQGDHPSPQFFDIFMDSLLRLSNNHPDRALASLFVNDVLLLGRAQNQLQDLVNIAEEWADDVNMEWTITKSCGLKLPFRLSMGGHDLPDDQNGHIPRRDTRPLWPN